MTFKKSVLKTIVCPVLASVTLLLFYVFPYNSRVVEDYYSRGFFQLYRQIWDSLLGWIPVPLIYIFLAAVFSCIAFLIAGIFKKYHGWKKKLSSVLMVIVNFISLLIILFYWLWGFNYKRENPLHYIESTESNITEDQLYSELERVTHKLTDIRAHIGDSIIWKDYTKKIKPSVLTEDLMRVFEFMSLPQKGNVKSRLLSPKGVLLRFSTAGVYIPFVGEGHVDAGLHPLTWPFTMIHEMSHGYGYTGEDLCNFWALLACANSKDRWVQYSGYFSYWRYLRSNAYLVDKERFKIYWKTVDSQIIADLNEVITYSERYPDIMPLLRDLIYDTYLKSHGVSDGLKNYSRIIVLANQWQEHYGHLQLRE